MDTVPCTMTSMYIQAMVGHKDELQSVLDCFTDKKPCNDVTKHVKVSKIPKSEKIKMKFVLLLPIFLALAGAETYSSENDDLDIEAVVKNLDTLKSFIDCFNDKKPCDEVQADFKKDLPEAFQEYCGKCTAAQKHIFRKFLEGAGEKLPKDLEELKKKYDPDSKHFAALQAAIANA
ncbi:unnamed protein product, partial [Iphiclides podalirius]